MLASLFLLKGILSTFSLGELCKNSPGKREDLGSSYRGSWVARSPGDSVRC